MLGMFLAKVQGDTRSHQTPLPSYHHGIDGNACDWVHHQLSPPQAVRPRRDQTGTSRPNTSERTGRHGMLTHAFHRPEKHDLT